MALQNTDPTKTEAWKKLSQHYIENTDLSLKHLFVKDSDRAKKHSIRWNEFFVDFSKNRITEETLQLLLQLANEVGLKDAIQKQFEGGIINQTEGRAVLHTALRAKKSDVIKVDGVNIVPEVYEVKQKIKSFTESVISGSKKGYTGKAFTDVVNIGIGGSDLGPAMVVEALKFYGNHLKMHFVSNVDGDHVYETLKGLNPETTLFVVVSKTFTTQETLSNATTIKKWFLKHATQADVAKHFAAVSTNAEKISEFGIDADNVFHFGVPLDYLLVWPWDTKILMPCWLEPMKWISILQLPILKGTYRLSLRS